MCRNGTLLARHLTFETVSLDNIVRIILPKMNENRLKVLQTQLRCLVSINYSYKLNGHSD